LIRNGQAGAAADCTPTQNIVDQIDRHAGPIAQILGQIEGQRFGRIGRRREGILRAGALDIGLVGGDLCATTLRGGFAPLPPGEPRKTERQHEAGCRGGDDAMGAPALGFAAGGIGGQAIAQ